MERMQERAKKDIEFMFGKLDEIDVDNMRTEGVTVRIGNRIMKLEMVSDDPITIEDEIRKEFREKLTSQLQKIKERINSKITEMSSFVSGIKKEYERKEDELKRRLDRAQPMPDVLISHAEQGLSVVKGSNKDEMFWLVQGVYWPKYVDFIPIEQRYSKKMISYIVFLIETKGNEVRRITTRKPLGLNYFEHYHQSRPDCWGHWKHIKKWEKPADIIQIAREAEVVLENINTGSLAINNPRGLPRKATLMRHLLKEKDKQAEDKMGTLSQADRRAGVSANVRETDTDNIWIT